MKIYHCIRVAPQGKGILFLADEADDVIDKAELDAIKALSSLSTVEFDGEVCEKESSGKHSVDFFFQEPKS